MKRMVTETVCDICGRSTIDPKATSTWSGFVSFQDVCPICIESMKRQIRTKAIEYETDPAKMTNKELANALREDAEWAHANEWETPITLADDLEEAAERLENLTTDIEVFKMSEQKPDYGENVLAFNDTGLPYVGFRSNLGFREIWEGQIVEHAPDYWVRLDALYDAVAKKVSKSEKG